MLDPINSKKNKMNKLAEAAHVTTQHFHLALPFDDSDDSENADDGYMACSDIYDSAYLNWCLVGSDGHDALNYLIENSLKKRRSTNLFSYLNSDLEPPAYFENFEQASVFMKGIRGSFIDVIEICGGAAGVSKA